MKKRIISAFMTVVLIMSVFSAAGINVFAVEANPTLSKDGNFYYVSEDGKAEIAKCLIKKLPEKYTIPSTIDGYEVETIGIGAFASKSGAVEITVPETVKVIKSGAFDYCENLKKLNIGASTEEIDVAIVNGSTKLTEINVADENQYFTSVDGVLFSKDMTTIIRYPEGKTATEYTLPETTRTIARFAFADCKHLTKVVLNDGLESIKMFAFQHCDSIKEYAIPDSVTNIDTEAFYETSGIRFLCSRDSVAAWYAEMDSSIGVKYTDVIYITDLSLNASVIRWPVGKRGMFRPTILPENAEYKSLDWESSNPKVAEINYGGELYAVAPGTATITCKTTDGSNLKATCKVTVGASISKIKLNVNSLTWPIGKKGVFSPTITPENAIIKKLVWSTSDPEVATIDQNGKIVAVGEGTATIICAATDGSGKSDSCQITVKKGVASSLKLNTTKINWPIGKSGHFKATVLPADCASQKLSWISSNPKVATVNENGKLTAVSVGTTTITCRTTDGSNLKATCTVTIGRLVSSVKLNCKTINWPVGKSASFKATVSPTNAVNKTLSWISSNTSVATISSTGKLTAVGAGTTTITCKATDGSGKYATCKVTVYNVKATSLKLNAASIVWEVGKTGYFSPTVSPSNTTNKKLEWISTNPKVATISKTGKLTAVAPGTTKIICRTTDGSNKVAYCQIMVTRGEMAKNYSNLFKKYFRDGTYAINGAVEYIDLKTGKTYDSKLQLGVTHTGYYMYEIDNVSDTKTISGPDGTGIILYDMKFSDHLVKSDATLFGIPSKYYNVRNDYYMHLTDEPIDTLLLENLTCIRTGKEKIGTVTYDTETFVANFEYETIFYFDDGELAFIKFSASDWEEEYVVKVKSIQGTFKYTDYKAPSSSVRINVKVQ